MANTLIIACGALAHELVAVLKANRWEHMDVQCLPAGWHNTPDRIAPGVEQKILDNRDHVDQILIAYGDCGTGGHLDAVIERHHSAELSVQRLPGPHCYSFFTGEPTFEELVEEDIGTFYLTDYLAEHFDRLILAELGIEKHPELLDMYFGNYTRLLYLAQSDNPKTLAKAQAAADALKLPLQVHRTGLAPFTQSMITIHAADTRDSR